MTDLVEGSRFGNYVVGACIRHGAVARIYRAEHQGLRRSVALKVLIDGYARESGGYERFLQEARIAAAIKHPNVVNIFDVGVQDSVPYLVMELLEGEDLETLLLAEGKLTEPALIEIIIPILAGLSAVHDAGFVHRDLKPGNIYLSRGRHEQIEPKLLDFGISKATKSEQFKLTAARSLLMGTPQYMSPEAVAGGDVTALSDQYSLGVVLYECCTGLNPFRSSTLAETVRRMTTGDFPPPTEHNPELSKRMAKLIARAMSIDPEHRFADLKEMGRELLSLAAHRTQVTWSSSFGEVSGKRLLTTVEDTPGTAPTPRRTAPPPRSKPPGGTPWWHGKRASLAAGVFGVASLVVAALIFWSSWSADRQRGVTPTIPGLSGSSPLPPARSVPPRPKPADPSRGVGAPPPPETPGAREPAAAGAWAPGVAPRAPGSPAQRESEQAAPAPSIPERFATERPRAVAPPRPPPPRASTPVSVESEDESRPGWVISRPVAPPPAAPKASRRPPVGTNAAPIFE